jgi:beta-lactamase regulating signal transducer with metallopeptidase domain
LTDYQAQVIRVADILPREIAVMVGDMKIAHKMHDYSVALTGLSHQNYPYLLGLILMIVPALFLLLASYLRCRKRTNVFRKVCDERILNIWEQVKGGAKHVPQLLDSGEDLHPPVLFGFFRQKLLLPVSHLKTLSDSEVELLLTHEFIHYRSGDGIINILTLFLWPFCWYNPFFLAARRRLRINCELACDAEVLKRFPERTAEYGKLLLSFVHTAKTPEVTLAFREYSGELRDRILYMTGLSQRRKSSPWATLALGVILIAPFGLVSAITRDNGPELPVTAIYLIPAKSSPAEKNELGRWKIIYPEKQSSELGLVIGCEEKRFTISLAEEPSIIRFVSGGEDWNIEQIEPESITVYVKDNSDFQPYNGPGDIIFPLFWQKTRHLPGTSSINLTLL